MLFILFAPRLLGSRCFSCCCRRRRRRIARHSYRGENLLFACCQVEMSLNHIVIGIAVLFLCVHSSPLFIAANI